MSEPKLPLPPVIAKLRTYPRTRYGNVTFPEGTPQAFTKEIAHHFLSLMSTSEVSLNQLLHDHPELPPFRQLDSWRANNKHGFGDAWRKASHDRAHFLVQMCLDLQKGVNAKNAHQVRVRFDILRWVAAKLHPAAYAEKTAATPTQTTVNVGVSIAPERLNELRAKLDQTRSVFAIKKKTPNGATGSGAE